MKKIFLIASLFFVSFFVKADEGMWLPLLLEQLNIEDMQALGFKLSAEDIYSVNKSSMKDGVVLFGGGCTGVIVSNEGLLMTNHHCGGSSIGALSTVDNNYLRDGFWAKSKAEEKPCPGLSVTFIISMFNVTDSILPYLSDDMDEGTRNGTIRFLATRLENEFKKGTHYDASVKPFYYGNEFYLFLTEKFTDIRLVGAPPSSVGNYGGETDNWVWPRQTGDFSMFRIYAGSDNKPAAYNENNKPFIPRYSFPISLAGVEENDFTMVYGFPGRTQEYLTSYAVDLIINNTNPNRIACRDARLNIWDKFMANNDTITLQYASKKRSLANAYKKWSGEMLGLKINDAVVKKEDYEKLFQQWANTHEGKDYRNLLSELKDVYAEYKPYSDLIDYTSEAFFAPEIINFTNNFQGLISKIRSDTIAMEDIQKEVTRLNNNAEGFYKNYRINIDKEVFEAMMRIYGEKVSADLQSPYFKQQVLKYHHDYHAWTNAIFAKSVFTDKNKLIKLLTGFNTKKGKKLMQDPMYKLCEEVSNYYNEQITAFINPQLNEINVLMRKYMAAQMKMQPKETFYPDANLTLRVAYGNVKGYTAKDAVYYTYQTTDAGIEEKYIPNDEEFGMPEKLIALLKDNNFGRYANKRGELPIGFIANNHTTGGNSGSPVINANGQLIGLNFDRVWEGTMSDIMFDPDRCRNISLDIRYALFIIDKYAGAQNIIDELFLVCGEGEK